MTQADIDRAIGYAAAQARISVAELLGPGRPQMFVRARAAVAWAVWQQSSAIREREGPRAGLSTTEIAQTLGGRDRTLVLHLRQRCEALQANDPEYAGYCARVLAVLKGEALNWMPPAPEQKFERLTVACEAELFLLRRKVRHGDEFARGEVQARALVCGSIRLRRALVRAREVAA